MLHLLGTRSLLVKTVWSFVHSVNVIAAYCWPEVSVCADLDRRQ